MGATITRSAVPVTPKRLLAGAVLTTLIAAVAIFGILDARANQRAGDLRADVAATFDGATSAEFLTMWNDDGINPPTADPALVLALTTNEGQTASSYGIDQGEVFALYKTGAFLTERCVRIIITASSVTLDDSCVLIDRT